MTVSNTQNVNEYQGDGIQTTFPYTYRILEESDMQVYLDLVLQTDGYSVTGANNQSGGDVIFVIPPDAGVQIILERLVPITQLIDYEEYDPFPANASETGLDKGTMIDQQLQEQLGRTIKVPLGDEDPPIFNIGDDAANKMLNVDSTGNQIVAITTFAEFQQSKDDAIEAAQEAQVSANLSQTYADLSAGYRDQAEEWAQAPEDLLIDDGVNPPGFSAFNWAKKAQELVAAGGVIPIGGAVTDATGIFVDDLNSMDWTGNPNAVGTAFQINIENTAKYSYSGQVWEYFGPKPVTIGLGGTYTVQDTDVAQISTSNADQINFDPNNSNLTSNDVQAAIDELDGLVEDNADDITTNASGIANNTILISQVVTGYKNVLINADFRVNQRSFDGNWGGVSDGNYGWDRWKKSGSDIQQVIEAQNVLANEDYTLSWTGGGTADVRNLSGAVSTNNPSPVTFNMNSGSSNPYVIVPVNATFIQLELGDSATSFEVRSIGIEWALCRRYFQRNWIAIQYQATGNGNYQHSYPTEPLRVLPISDNSGMSLTNSSSAGIKIDNNNGMAEFIVSTSTNNCKAQGWVTLTAEL